MVVVVTKKKSYFIILLVVNIKAKMNMKFRFQTVRMVKQVNIQIVWMYINIDSKVSMKRILIPHSVVCARIFLVNKFCREKLRLLKKEQDIK